MRGETMRKQMGLIDLMISIHSPHAGRDDGDPKTDEKMFEFQSTLPMRGETTYSEQLEQQTAISIHSPHAGRDKGGRTRCLKLY